MDEYKVRKANREQKLKARRSAMIVSGRSVFVIKAVLDKKTEKARAS